MEKEEKNKMSRKEADIKDFEDKRNHYLEDGYAEIIITVKRPLTILLISVFALLLLSFLIAYIFRYRIVWVSGFELFSAPIAEQSLALLKLFAAFLISLLVHEVLHAIGWAIALPTGFESISFGFDLRHFMPYCHCRDAMSKKQYLLGSVLPVTVLGIIPYFISYFCGSLYLLIFAVASIGGATCDIFTSLTLIRTKLKDGAILLDHPTEIGLHIYQN